MLWRALKGIEKGWYVDVGANDPVEHSVTKAFYDRGWRGINIAPVRHWYDRLVVERPEDVNLNIAASEKLGPMQMHEVVGTGLSTLDHEIAEAHRLKGQWQVREIMVECRSLDNILSAHPMSDIHFLKVGVEGAEREVFASIDLRRTRPWIILSEITGIQIWDSLVAGRGYVPVYFDGLNRFYLAEETAALRAAFEAPPKYLMILSAPRNTRPPSSCNRQGLLWKNKTRRSIS
jgi:FkbM family methyltransferase